MKVDLSKEIINYDGKPIPDGEKSTKNLTVGAVIIVALNFAIKGDDEDTGEQRQKKWEIMQTAHKNMKGSMELDSDDATMLKDRVRKVYPSPTIYGNICEAFGDKK